MSIFDGIDGAKASFDANYIRPGVHTLELTGLQEGVNRRKIPYFLATFIVLATSDDSPHAAGDEVSWLQTLDKDAALGSIKQFMSALLEIRPDDVTKNLLTGGKVTIDGKDYQLPGGVLKDNGAMFSRGKDKNGNVVEGSHLKCRATNKLTKEGKDFTRTYWMPADADEDIPE